MSERKTTRFAVLEAERVVKVHEREIPALKADEVLIKNGACNICTTDYGQYTGARKNLMFPMAWGHEFAGTIVDMGSDVKEFEVGEMVGIGYDNCGECEFCKKGLTSECVTLGAGRNKLSPDGYHGGFGCSEYVIKPYRSLFKLNQNMDPSEAFSFLEKYAAFDDVNEENMSQDEKKQRAERFQNYIKAGNQNMTDDGAENYVKDIVSGEWHLFDSASKELTEENCTLEKTSFFFERMVDGVPVNYIRNSYLPYNELSRPWIDEDDNFHEAKCDVWDNESLTMIFCSGTLQSFQHSDPIEVSDASDEALFLLPFDEIKDIFEKTITMQIMTEQENRLPAVDGISFTRYPSIDAQTVEMTITKVQLGYMRVRNGSSSTEGSLIPVWDFYGTWNSQEPAYADGGDEMVIDSVTMDRIGVPLLTIDARDGSVVQRVQSGPSTTFPGGIGECE